MQGGRERENVCVCVCVLSCVCARAHVLQRGESPDALRSAIVKTWLASGGALMPAGIDDDTSPIAVHPFTLEEVAGPAWSSGEGDAGEQTSRKDAPPWIRVYTDGTKGINQHGGDVGSCWRGGRCSGGGSGVWMMRLALETARHQPTSHCLIPTIVTSTVQNAEVHTAGK